MRQKRHGHSSSKIKSRLFQIHPRWKQALTVTGTMRTNVTLPLRHLHLLQVIQKNTVRPQKRSVQIKWLPIGKRNLDGHKWKRMVMNLSHSILICSAHLLSPQQKKHLLSRLIFYLHEVKHLDLVSLSTKLYGEATWKSAMTHTFLQSHTI